MGWWVEEVKLLLRGLDSSNFMPSGSDTWYFSFSSILTAEEEEEEDDDGEEEWGDAAPGSGDTSLGGVGGNGYSWELLWDGGVSGDAETAFELLLHG